MNSREFDFYINGKFDFDNMNAGMIVIEGMLQDIDIILRDYNLEEEKKKYLMNKKQIISDFFNKYKQIFSKKRFLNKSNYLRKYDVDLPY